MAPLIDVRSGTGNDWPALLEAFGSTFGVVFADEAQARLTESIEPSRLIVATDGGTVVGTAGSFAFEMTVPGGQLPTAGVTLVGVRASHRRRGILRQLMRFQLDRLHESGEPLALLWASEAAIYQRFGYGLGVRRATIELARGGSDLLNDPGPIGQARLIDKAEALALLPPIYERARTAIPGSLVRPRSWWERRILLDPAWARHGAGEMFRAVLTIDSVPAAYALYRYNLTWADDGLPGGNVEVVEALGTSPAATREIWRFLMGIDIVPAVRCGRLTADHPLFLMLSDPRRLRMRVFDGVWLRLVDATGALTGRRYAARDSLVIELSDSFCAWNAGRWALDASEDGAQVRPSTASPDLRLGARELAAMYLGTVTCAGLLLAGQVDEETPGAARRADALFRADAPPWCLDDF